MPHPWPLGGAKFGEVSLFHFCTEFARRAMVTLMLTQLLPGFREVRAPLVTGYLYLALGWIWLYDSDLAESGQLADLEALLDHFGSAGRAALATIVAYLIGSLLMQLPRLTGAVIENDQVGQNPQLDRLVLDLWSKNKNLARRLFDAHADGGPPQVTTTEDQVVSTLYRFVNDPIDPKRKKTPTQRINERPLLRWLLRRWRKPENMAEHRYDTKERRDRIAVRYVWHELKNYEIEQEVAERLLQADEALYDRYDRFTAEWDLRQGVAPPSAALAIILAWDVAIPVWASALVTLLAVVTFATFYYHGWMSRARSRGVLARAIGREVVRTPFIDLLGEVELAPDVPRDS